MPLQASDLRRVRIFQEVSEEDLHYFLSRSILRAVEEGEFLFFQGDVAEFCYVLISGKVKLVQSTPTGHVVNLRVIHAWQVFGAIGAIKPGSVYPVSAQAILPSTVLAIRSTLLNEAMKTRPFLCLALMQQIAGYVHEIQERYRESVTERVEQRIARILLRLAQQTGVKTGAGVLIELPFSRQDLAEMAGTTLFTISRTFSRWEKQGLVVSGRKQVILTNLHGIVQVAEGILGEPDEEQ